MFIIFVLSKKRGLLEMGFYLYFGYQKEVTFINITCYHYELIDSETLVEFQLFTFDHNHNHLRKTVAHSMYSLSD